MSTWKKLYERIKRNPKHVAFDELDTLLRRAGFTRRQPSGGSSHYIYSKAGKARLVVPRHKPLKPIYVKLALEALEGEFDDE